MDFSPASPSIQETSPHFREEESKKNIKIFECPSCGNRLSITAVGITIVVACQYCSSLISVKDEPYTLIEKANRNTHAPFLEIGMRGILKNICWEIIGYIEKTHTPPLPRDLPYRVLTLEDNLDPALYVWDEYLLYNPYYGFRFLVENRGHWSFVKVLKQAIPLLFEKQNFPSEVELNHTQYSQFQEADSVVTSLKGEFYRHIRKGESIRFVTYNAPPYMLTIENNDGKINRFLGKYIEPGEIAKAFGIVGAMPPREGIAINQVFSCTKKHIHDAFMIAGAIILFISLIQLKFVIDAKNISILYKIIDVRPIQKGEPIYISSITIPEDGNLAIKSFSSLAQTPWTNIKVVLINEKTNERYEINQNMKISTGRFGTKLEYDKEIIPKINKGSYNVFAAVDSQLFRINKDVRFSLSLKRDVPMWSKFVKLVLFCLFCPTFLLLQRLNIEHRRIGFNKKRGLFPEDDIAIILLIALFIIAMFGNAPPSLLFLSGPN